LIYRNQFGVIGIPIYLTVAIITASIILIIFAKSIVHILEESQTDIVKKQIEKIISEAENMFEYADSGSKIKIELDFPESMSFAVFGKMPDNTSKPTNLEINEQMSNNYYFVMQNKEICSYSSNARFCGESTNKIAVLNKGKYSIYLELVYFDGKTYVKIY